MNLFELLVESISRKHDQTQAGHDRVIFEQQKELETFDRSAEQFGRQIEAFAENAEKWLGEDGSLPGIFK
ncbi:hypothetical protein MOC99_13165 [Bacillus haynesii]|uniref:hypothetical protein n=1 Tax=Bacillus haynesii TaxID=1925021 RepID=UPI00227E564A|nr:hypothetical protein [Bacillus haynesii]MCY8011989.1 hypothetical protein [Bacillus haynesii]MCY8346399.1 hypothetical protein [Bacillus haynesii]MCY8350792.1 hypothetical protein [Bacillus haynesii]MCY8557704.1 hypothetical protein [Bacillus haynesii]MCY9371621.1 hypothetical protein [Bacillus haynesii]